VSQNAVIDQYSECRYDSLARVHDVRTKEAAILFQQQSLHPAPLAILLISRRTALTFVSRHFCSKECTPGCIPYWH